MLIKSFRLLRFQRWIYSDLIITREEHTFRIYSLMSACIPISLPPIAMLSLDFEDPVLSMSIYRKKPRAYRKDDLFKSYI